MSLYPFVSGRLKYWKLPLSGALIICTFHSARLSKIWGGWNTALFIWQKILVFNLYFQWWQFLEPKTEKRFVCEKKDKPHNANA